MKVEPQRQPADDMTSIAIVIVVIAGWTLTSRRRRQIELKPEGNRPSHAAR